jgi:predicted ATPase
LAINDQGSEFNKWEILVEPFRYDPRKYFHNILVNTKESVVNIWFLQRFVHSQKDFLIYGGPGTGKTQVIDTFFEEYMENHLLPLKIVFSKFSDATGTEK